MSKRILIAYASKAGSTADTAARMGETLAKRGLAVDVMPANKAADVAAYDAVILGSGIMAGKPQPDALKFVEVNKSALQGKPFHAFYHCLALEKDTPENRKTAETYKDAVRAVLAPKSDAVFAGAMDPSKLGFFEKTIMKAMKAPTGDFRKWDEINAWLNGLALN